MEDNKIEFFENNPENQEPIAETKERPPYLIAVFFLIIFILIPIAISRYPVIHPLINSGPHIDGGAGLSWSEKLYKFGFPTSWIIFIYPAFALAWITKLLIEKKDGKLSYLHKSILYIICALLLLSGLYSISFEGRSPFLIEGGYLFFIPTAVLQYIIVYLIGITLAIFSTDLSSFLKFKLSPIIAILVLVIVSSIFWGPIGTCTTNNSYCMAKRELRVKNGNLCNYSKGPNYCYAIWVGENRDKSTCNSIQNSYYRNKCMCNVDGVCAEGKSGILEPIYNDCYKWAWSKGTDYLSDSSNKARVENILNNAKNNNIFTTVKYNIKSKKEECVVKMKFDNDNFFYCRSFQFGSDLGKKEAVNIPTKGMNFESNADCFVSLHSNF